MKMTVFANINISLTKPIINVVVGVQTSKFGAVIDFCEQVVRDDVTPRESTRGRDHFDFW